MRVLKKPSWAITTQTSGTLKTVVSCSLFLLNDHEIFIIQLQHPHHLVCDPAKIFFTSKFSYLLFFCNPTHKTETGTANLWKLQIANPVDQTLCLTNQKQGAIVRSYLLHSSLAGEQSWDIHQPQQMDHICSRMEHICPRKTIFLS